MAKKRGNNEGSIYELQDGRWRAAISLGFENGKPKRKVFTAVTRAEVAKDLGKAIRDLQLGIQPIPERQTVGEFLNIWLRDVARMNVRPGTLASYKWIIEKHLVPNLGRTTLAKLSPQQVQKFLNDRLELGRIPRPFADPAKPQETGLTPRTVQHIHATLRAALEQATKWGLVQRNVATLVNAPRVQRAEVDPYTPEEARAFLSAVSGDRLEALYSVAIALGLRQGEALGLRWCDIDIAARRLTVRHSLQRIGGKLSLGELKTGRSRRSITLPQVTISALLRHQGVQDTERQFAGGRWRDTGHVFTTTIGTPLDGPTVTRRFQDILKANGLRKLRFHDLRHTCATLLLAQGVHPRLIMEILGHSQIAITMNLYSHVIPSMRNDVADQIDIALAPPQKKAPKRVATRVATKRAPAVVN